MTELSREQKEHMLELLQEKHRRIATTQLVNYFPDESDIDNEVYGRELYPKAMAFFEAGAKFKQRAIIAANRTGKTLNAHIELVYHVTGMYPHWWKGRKFDRPIQAWVASVNNEAVRDISQAYLIGSKMDPGTGLIPKSCLADKPFTSRAGIPDAVQDIFVKHASGGISKISLKSYEQGRKAFQGTSIDVICLDEEPDDPGIYTECLTRTMTTKGMVIATFTPLSGLSATVKSFIPKGKFPDGGYGRVEGSDKFVMNITWDDIPHLSKEEKDEMMRAYLPHEREARTKGIPSLGAGLIYPVDEAEYVIDPFPIPAYWAKAYGMDVGWEKTAAVWIALDEDTDTMYAYSEHYRSNAEPSVHAESIRARGEWMYGACDPAGTNMADGERMLHAYQKLGLNLVPAKKAVDAGLLECWQRLSEGRFKVFSHLENFKEEIRFYRRDEKGKVIKQDDHLMDAWRYALMTPGIFQVPNDEDDEDEVFSHADSKGRNPVTGY